jgi:hypothetical protein
VAETGDSVNWRTVVARAANELDAEHQPTWASPEMQARGKDPVGCQVCWPNDGDWPCTSSMVALDLRRLLA